MSYLCNPGIKLADLRQTSGSGEVSSVNKDIPVRNGSADVRGKGMSVGHTNKPELHYKPGQ